MKMYRVHYVNGKYSLKISFVCEKVNIKKKNDGIALIFVN